MNGFSVVVSVGRNACLLLNVPPDRRGRFHDADVRSLKGLKRMLDETFRTNLAAGKPISASRDFGGRFTAEHLTDGNGETSWSAGDTVCSFTIDLGAPARWNLLLLQEDVRMGQRVEGFSVESWDGSAWSRVGTGTTIGCRRYLKFPETSSRKVRVSILASRGVPVLSEAGLYRVPAAPGETH